MQFLARSLSQSIRTSLSLTTRQSWALSRQCHSNFSTNSSHGVSSAEEWPKPKEIPYQTKVKNCVDLIGYVSQPVAFNDPPDGKFWAGTVISHAPSHASESELESPSNFRVPVVFEGELAQTANCHLKKDDRIHISGQMFVDFPFGANHGEANVQVMVRDFHYIKGSNAPSKVSPTPDYKEDVLKHSASVQKRGNFGNGSWFDLLEKPDEWCDYRESIKNGSVNPKHPDFKKKDGTVALWLNKAPNEILSNLQDVKFDTPVKSKYSKQKAGEESWKDLVENKDKWWDNRLNKKYPKAPDFKHKDTGVGLWLDNCPNELVTKLPSLNKDVPTPKKSPTSVQNRQDFGTDGWSALLEKPDEWCDYRESKQNGSVNPKHPDFKKKDGSVALWLSRAPNEILPNLKDVKFDTPVKSKYSKQNAGVESWKDLVENKDKWWDNRLNKRNEKAPDFTHKETRVALWLKDCPNELVTKLPLPTPQKSPNEQKKAREELWKDLVDNLDKWTDNRLNKKNPKAPDFKHNDAGVGLWLNNCPDWVPSRLPPSKEAGDSTFMKI